MKIYIALDKQLQPIGKVEAADLNQAFARACQANNETATVRPTFDDDPVEKLQFLTPPAIIYNLTADDVEWIVNDNAELGVKIGNQFFFLYKGHSLCYPDGHDDGSPMRYRPVYKREFGECCHPVNLKNMNDFKVEGDQWREISIQ